MAIFDNKRILRLFWPVLIEQSFATMIGLISTMMVGAVGDAAVAGVGLVSSINFMVMNCFTAVASGVTVIVAQYVGRNAYNDAGEISSQSLVLVTYLSFLMGLLMIIFDMPILTALFPNAAPEVVEHARVYLFYSSVSMPLQAVFSTIAGVMRAVGNSRTPMIGSVLSNIFNVLVAAITIHPLRMGVSGAGIALVAARIVPAVFLCLMLVRGSSLYVPRPKLKLDFKLLAPALHIAVPCGFDSLLFNGGKLIVQVFMAGMGTAVLAANSIVGSVASFLNLPGAALQIVIVTVVGQTFGSGDRDGAHRQTVRLTIATHIAETAFCLAMLPLAAPLLSLFKPSPDAFSLAMKITIIAIIFTPVSWPTSFVLPQAMRAVGDARFTMYVSVGSMVIVRVLGSWVLGVLLGWGLIGIWASMILDWFVRSAFFITRAVKKTYLKRNAA